MIPEVLYRRQKAIAAATGFTGAAPQTVTGAAIDMSQVMPGALGCLATVLADTNTLTITAKWQVKDDSGNWQDVTNGSQNAAGVALATGTAGADTAVTRLIQAPMAVHAFKWARIVFTSGVGVGGGAGVDEVTSAVYRSLGDWR